MLPKKTKRNVTRNLTMKTVMHKLALSLFAITITIATASTDPFPGHLFQLKKVQWGNDAYSFLKQ